MSRHATIYQVILFSFAFFGILAFGFLHMELADFVRNPSFDLITTLMRLQPAVFPIFALYLLNQIYPRVDKQAVSLKISLWLFFLYALLLTSTRTFGLFLAIETFQISPVISIIAVVVGATAIWLAFRPALPTQVFNPGPFNLLCLGFFIISLIPQVYSYIKSVA